MSRIFFIFLSLCLLLSPIKAVKAADAKANSNPPSCSNAGAISCPNGYKPSCPKSYQPSCIFLGTMQMPACLANNLDNQVFSYDLDKVGCQKNK